MVGDGFLTIAVAIFLDHRFSFGRTLFNNRAIVIAMLANGHTEVDRDGLPAAAPGGRTPQIPIPCPRTRVIKVRAQPAVAPARTARCRKITIDRKDFGAYAQTDANRPRVLAKAYKMYRSQNNHRLAIAVVVPMSVSNRTLGFCLRRVRTRR